jgi:hypothetical protein
MNSTKSITQFFFLPLLLSGWLLGAAILSQAQSNVQLDQLSIRIWPEYDRPETLVIYRGQLADSVPLPAGMTFFLPGHIETLNAVAAANAQGSLINTPYTADRSGDFLRLDFTVDSPSFQFEYYDPAILSKDGTEHTLTFQTQSAYPTANWDVEIQQPPTATDVTFLPQADDTFVGDNQFTYHVFRQANAAPGQSITVQGSYQKETDALAVNVQAQSPPPASPPLFEPAAEPASSITPGYWLIGGGVILLLAAGGWWVFVKQSKTEPATFEPTSAGQSARFCYNCGTAYHSDAHFCHNCGARRQRRGKQ